ncbi:rbcL [Symbiodinium sp. CCMP2592]|nr:rbcL [Symbiodinium sp. CCMP2592]
MGKKPKTEAPWKRNAKDHGYGQNGQAGQGYSLWHGAWRSAGSPQEPKEPRPSARFPSYDQQWGAEPHLCVVREERVEAPERPDAITAKRAQQAVNILRKAESRVTRIQKEQKEKAARFSDYEQQLMTAFMEERKRHTERQSQLVNELEEAQKLLFVARENMAQTAQGLMGKAQMEVQDTSAEDWAAMIMKYSEVPETQESHVMDPDMAEILRLYRSGKLVPVQAPQPVPPTGSGAQTMAGHVAPPGLAPPAAGENRPSCMDPGTHGPAYPAPTYGAASPSSGLLRSAPYSATSPVLAKVGEAPHGTEQHVPSPSMGDQRPSRTVPREDIKAATKHQPAKPQPAGLSLQEKLEQRREAERVGAALHPFRLQTENMEKGAPRCDTDGNRTAHQQEISDDDDPGRRMTVNSPGLAKLECHSHAFQGPSTELPAAGLCVLRSSKYLPVNKQVVVYDFRALGGPVYADITHEHGILIFLDARQAGLDVAHIYLSSANAAESVEESDCASDPEQPTVVQVEVQSTITQQGRSQVLSTAASYNVLGPLEPLLLQNLPATTEPNEGHPGFDPTMLDDWITSDPESEAELTTVPCAILRVEYVPEHLTVAVPVPTTQEEVIEAIQAVRRRDSSLAFPTLLSVLPQPALGIAVLAALPPWASGSDVVCFDTTTIDGRLFLAQMPQYCSKIGLIRSAGLLPGLDYEVLFGVDQIPVGEDLVHLFPGALALQLVTSARCETRRQWFPLAGPTVTQDSHVYVRDVPWPLPVESATVLDNGDLVSVQPRNHGVLVLTGFADMLRDPRCWTHTNYAASPLGDRLWILADDHPRHFTFDRRRRALLRRDLAGQLHVPERDLRIRPARSTLGDLCVQGVWVSTAVIATSSDIRLEATGNGLFPYILDARPVLLGVEWAANAEGVLNLRSVERRFQARPIIEAARTQLPQQGQPSDQMLICPEGDKQPLASTVATMLDGPPQVADALGLFTGGASFASLLASSVDRMLPCTALHIQVYHRHLIRTTIGPMEITCGSPVVCLTPIPVGPCVTPLHSRPDGMMPVIPMVLPPLLRLLADPLPLHVEAPPLESDCRTLLMTENLLALIPRLTLSPCLPPSSAPQLLLHIGWGPRCWNSLCSRPGSMLSTLPAHFLPPYLNIHLKVLPSCLLLALPEFRPRHLIRPHCHLQVFCGLLIMSPLIEFSTSPQSACQLHVLLMTLRRF